MWLGIVLSGIYQKQGCHSAHASVALHSLPLMLEWRDRGLSAAVLCHLTREQSAERFLRNDKLLRIFDVTGTLGSLRVPMQRANFAVVMLQLQCKT
jgi:hypothetical protein